jgi:hypothetical protein
MQNFVMKPLVKSPLERPRMRWDNINIDLMEIDYKNNDTDGTSSGLYPIVDFAISGAASYTSLLTYRIGIGVFYPGVRRPGCETDHSPPTSAEVKYA